MEWTIEERLHDAAEAIRDDIRGIFKSSPEYRDYLVDLLHEARADIGDLRQLIPAPPPES